MPSSVFLHYQSCQHEAEDGGDVGNGAVAFVVRVNRFLVFQKLIGIDALELALWEHFVTFESVAEGTRQRVARNLPELSNLDARWVELQGSTHR